MLHEVQYSKNISHHRGINATPYSVHIGRTPPDIPDISTKQTERKHDRVKWEAFVPGISAYSGCIKRTSAVLERFTQVIIRPTQAIQLRCQIDSSSRQ